jgi:hypothetical protein
MVDMGTTTFQSLQMGHLQQWKTHFCVLQAK